MAYGQSLYRAYRGIGHGGDLFGYHSQVQIFPDLKLGMFFSSTTDMWYGMNMGMTLITGVFDIIMGFDQYIDPQTICTTYPNVYYPPMPPVNTTGITTICDLSSDANLKVMPGIYNHPFFGTLALVQLNGFVRFNFEKYGNGISASGTSIRRTTIGLSLTLMDLLGPWTAWRWVWQRTRASPSTWTQLAKSAPR
jgi:hypothetical protein